MSIKGKIRFLRFNLKRRWVLLRLMLLGNGRGRAKYLKNKNIFGSIGENCWYEPCKLPAEPKLVYMGDNVNIATDVTILNHDIINFMINDIRKQNVCKIRRGKVEIGSNVFTL